MTLLFRILACVLPRSQGPPMGDGTCRHYASAKIRSCRGGHVLRECIERRGFNKIQSEIESQLISWIQQLSSSATEATESRRA